MHVYIHMYVCIIIYIYIYTYTYIYIHVCMCIYIYTHVYTHIHIHIYTLYCINKYIYIYIYIYTNDVLPRLSQDTTLASCCYKVHVMRAYLTSCLRVTKTNTTPDTCRAMLFCLLLVVPDCRTAANLRFR